MVVRQASYGVVGVLVLVLAGCGSGRDEASEKACGDATAVLGKYDEMKDSVVEIRAVLIQSIQKKLREIAEPATGEVKTSIVAVADTIGQSGISSSDDFIALGPKFLELEPKLATARKNLADSCA
ncbi:hypothetical protein [Actinoplanes sp. NBRC 103695]|uniref:hypothetical protein n=1 Tax=Actinoplanes sp. NBRC 103695 TaxID=3032202 RepID=UPI0024A1EE73|nr:hypothetical protein [Actinoplanes sp. NBRC 103695]GLY97965.1 hypothetical protein Acsp02_52190 [Actinoplanes sp. NBRC 103695]